MPKFLSADLALAFLLIHDPKECETFKFDLPLHSIYPPDTLEAEGVADVKDCLLTVKTTSPLPDLKQDITVVATAIDRVFTFSGNFTYIKGDYPLKDVTARKGTLYLRGTIPDLGKGDFNAQQYPPYNVNVQDGGRVVIDFWGDDSIAGVFKTDEENYSSGGEGQWSAILRQ